MIAMNSNKNIRTLQGTAITKQEQVRYLGVILHRKAATEPELNERIKQTMATWMRLDKLWKFKSLRVKTKLLYWNALIKSKLLYGLHTMVLKTGQITKLQAVQMKGLRKIIKAQHPYINRHNTNGRIIQRVNQWTKYDNNKEYIKKHAKAKPAPTGKKQKPPKKSHTNQWYFFPPNSRIRRSDTWDTSFVHSKRTHLDRRHYTTKNYAEIFTKNDA